MVSGSRVHLHSHASAVLVAMPLCAPDCKLHASHAQTKCSSTHGIFPKLDSMVVPFIEAGPVKTTAILK